MNLKSLLKNTSRHLDELGCDQITTWKRINSRKKLSDAKAISTKEILKRNEIEKVIVGSQCDGTGFNHCNDLDVLQINHNVLCLNEQQPDNIEKSKVIFKTVQNNTPGYFYLKLVNEGDSETFHQLEYALVERNGEKYLSSELFMMKNEDVFQESTGWISKNTVYHPREGPSNPKHTSHKQSESLILSCLNLETKGTDVVRAFPCETGSIIKEWSMRERKCGWPSEKTIAHVEKLPAHVVPVGQRGSEEEDLQWRVCFTLGEIHLIQDFNTVQKKIFVVMKLIAKTFLQPINKDVTSYIVKNVMLWITEGIPKRKFRQKHLVARLKDALMYLLEAIKNKHLPSYMIPARNLFEGKIKENHHELVATVTKYINEIGPLLCKLEPVLSTLKTGCEIDKIQTTMLAQFTTTQLAEIYVQMYFCQSQENMLSLNIQFNAVPFLNIFAQSWFSKPFSVTQSRQESLHLENHVDDDFRKCMCDPDTSSKTVLYNKNNIENRGAKQMQSLFMSCICVCPTLLCVI